MVELVSFWKRKSKNDRVYYQGKLGNGRLLLLNNEKKEAEKHPDLILYIVPENESKLSKEDGSIGEEDIPL